MSKRSTFNSISVDLEKSTLAKLDRFISIEKDKLGFVMTRNQALEYLINKSVETDIEKRENRNGQK